MGAPIRRRTARQQKAHARYRSWKLGFLRWPCEVCGAEPAEFHHPDYRRPGRVIPLCRKHHMLWHSQFAGKLAPDPLGDAQRALRRRDLVRLFDRLLNAGPGILLAALESALAAISRPDLAG
jgi:hypothetical protein